MSLAPITEIIEELKAGRMVVLVDEEDRENEGDLVMAAEHVTPDAINFMAKHGRGLICLTLTDARCRQLGLKQMVSDNQTPHGTAFTVSIEAAEGVTTGISAQDRAVTIQAAVAKDARPSDIIQPGHIFPLRAQPGGVLVRAGHTEAGCDLAAMAGCSPAAVICEIMNDDGTMARLPDLQLFAAIHGLKIGTIADLIEHRSRTESLIEKVGTRPMNTAFGEFTTHAFKDKPGHGLHLALVKGSWTADESVPVRVHAPLSVLDTLEVNHAGHSWGLDTSMRYIEQQGKGVIVLLYCGETAEQLLAEFQNTAGNRHLAEPGRVDLRTYGVGAKILHDLGVQKMQLMAATRRLPSVTGYGLEITGYIPKE